MELINENDLQNVCGGNCALKIAERTATGLMLMGAFIGVCALAILTPSPKKHKKIERKQVFPSKKVVYTTEITYLN